MKEILIENHEFRVRLELFAGLALLHLSVYKWSKSAYKFGLDVVWPAVLDELRSRGFDKVYATPFADDLRAQKLIGKFGFDKLYEKNGLCVMRRSTKGA